MSRLSILTKLVAGKNPATWWNSAGININKMYLISRQTKLPIHKTGVARYIKETFRE